MRTSRAGSRASAPGFTLVELLVVLAIVGIVSALAAPAVASRFLERPPAKTARSVRGLFDEARRLAAETGAPVAAVWVPETRRFALELPEGATGLARPLAVEIPREVEAEVSGLVSVGEELAASFSHVASGDAEVHVARLDGILFFPIGGSTGGRVVLHDGESTVALWIDPLTGYTAYAPPN